jgi:hypothetical protein
MSSDSEASPLPGLPKAIFYVQVLSALMQEVKVLLDTLHHESSPGREKSGQSDPTQ